MKEITASNRHLSNRDPRVHAGAGDPVPPGGHRRGQVAFPGNANGQQVKVDGKLVGSKIIGQQFATQVVKNGKPQVDSDGNPVTVPDKRYFQSRPSPTVPPYNAGASTFSNLGPNDKATEESISASMKAYLAAREAV